jgi:hypothetical protein
VVSKWNNNISNTLLYKNNKEFIKVENYSNAKICHDIKSDWFSCLITSDHKIQVGSEIFWDWEDHFVKKMDFCWYK